MAATSSIDLDQDPRVIVGIREFDAPRALVFSTRTDPAHLAHDRVVKAYGADQGLVQTLGRLAEYVAALTD
jgi:hypothetical protein